MSTPALSAQDSAALFSQDNLRRIRNQRRIIADAEIANSGPHLEWIGDIASHWYHNAFRAMNDPELTDEKRASAAEDVAHYTELNEHRRQEHIRQNNIPDAPPRDPAVTVAAAEIKSQLDSLYTEIDGEDATLTPHRQRVGQFELMVMDNKPPRRPVMEERIRIIPYRTSWANPEPFPADTTTPDFASLYPGILCELVDSLTEKSQELIEFVAAVRRREKTHQEIAAMIERLHPGQNAADLVRDVAHIE